jgi:hypothetical protein
MLLQDDWFPNEGSRAAQHAPAKFEAGQVVSFALLEHDANRALVVKRTDRNHIYCEALDDSTQLLILSRIGYEGSATEISPAPIVGDTWSSDESVARVEAAGERLRIVTQDEPFVGDVVAVARRLWEGGYRLVSRARNADGGWTVYGVCGAKKSEIEAAMNASTRDVFRETMEDAAVQMTRLILGSEEAEKVRAEQQRKRERLEKDGS